MQNTNETCAMCEGHAVVDVCVHLIDAPAITRVAARCTACTGGAAELRRVCLDCFETIARSTIPVSDADRARGYAFATRRHYAALVGEARPHVPEVRVGGEIKVTLSAVPATLPTYCESLWIQVIAREGDRLTGTIDNDPAIVRGLAYEDPIEVDVGHVVDARLPAPLVERTGVHSCALCDPAARDGLDDGDRQLLYDVAQYGWHVVVVTPDDVGPGFAFSVGLHHTFEHPEVIVFGLDHETLVEVVNAVGAEVRDGRRLEPGTLLAGLLEGHTCRVDAVTDPDDLRDYLGYARWFYRASFPVLRLVWPDDAGRFPDDAAFDPDLAPLQPPMR